MPPHRSQSMPTPLPSLPPCNCKPIRNPLHSHKIDERSLRFSLYPFPCPQICRLHPIDYQRRAYLSRKLPLLCICEGPHIAYIIIDWNQHPTKHVSFPCPP